MTNDNDPVRKDEAEGPGSNPESVPATTPRRQPKEEMRQEGTLPAGEDGHWDRPDD